MEIGEGTGYRHWQLLVSFAKKGSLQGVIAVFGRGIHAELTRSQFAQAYCQKEESRVTGTTFELGKGKT